MTHNILITGAAGFIGGSLLAEFVSRTSGPIKDAKISAAVRTEEQAQSLSKLGVNVIQIDLSDEAAVSEAVTRNEIDIVVHFAGSSANPHLASNLIKALGERRKISGNETHFINSSITAVFSEEGGWPYGEVRDTDPIFEKEKQIGGPHPVRETNILVVEQGKAHGVTSFNVAIPNVYGRGTGEWRRLSFTIPAIIRDCIAQKKVYKFEKNGNPPMVHVSDLVAFYTLLVEKILRKEQIPSGEQGYYFGFAHWASWWDVTQRLADALYARGLVAEPKVEVWPSWEEAADHLGLPRPHVRSIGTPTGKLVPVNAYRLGWQPKWDQERFVGSVDDEVQAVLDLDTVKPTLFDALLRQQESN
ncbi:NAD(P)-binding protein [Hypoxylon sp. FL0543]|nr:NAD(P)-binding protein [Hypoxylon sp. FL0543]